MSPALLLIAILATISACFLLGLWWSHLRAEHLLREQAALTRLIARAEARAECTKLGRTVAFQLKGMSYAVAETRKLVEATSGMVREIAGIDGAAEPADEEDPPCPDS